MSHLIPSQYCYFNIVQLILITRSDTILLCLSSLLFSRPLDKSLSQKHCARLHCVWATVGRFQLWLINTVQGPQLIRLPQKLCVFAKTDIWSSQQTTRCTVVSHCLQTKTLYRYLQYSGAKTHSAILQWSNKQSTFFYWQTAECGSVIIFYYRDTRNKEAFLLLLYCISPVPWSWLPPLFVKYLALLYRYGK